MPPKYFLLDDQTSFVTRLKYRWVDHRKPVPTFPIHAQVETVSGCNANCIFCPNRKTALKVPIGEKMDPALFKKIVDELLDGGVQRLSPYLNNEPLLDDTLPERIAYITTRKQKGQYTKINSNGSLLTETMAKGLLDSGLDRLNFSVHGIEPEPYERVMGQKLDRVLRNIDRFLELKRAGHYKKPRVRVSMLVTAILEPQLPRIREYWGARGVKINLNQLENRGGHQGIVSNTIAAHPLERFDWCDRMFEQVFIAWTGQMILCCADWEQSTVMGDLRTDSIREIWNGRKYYALRRRFLDGKVKGMLCENCTKDSVGGDEDE